jgi:hypothetical protein
MSFVCMIPLWTLCMYTMGPNYFDISINSELDDILIRKPFTQQYHEDELAQEYLTKM